MAAARSPFVFLDTNVIFSGLYSRTGPPATILNRCADGTLQLVVSQLVLDELTRSLKTKASSALPRLFALLESALPTVVRSPSFAEVELWKALTSSDDAPILAAAIAARVDYLVTGDRHFFAPGIAEKAGLKIVTPRQFVKELGTQ